MMKLVALGAAIAVSMSLGAAHAKADPGLWLGRGNPEFQPVQYYPSPDEDESDGGGAYGGGGYGGGGYGGGYGGGEYGRGRISCWQGRRFVERSGFYRVRPRDCGGR